MGVFSNTTPLGMERLRRQVVEPPLTMHYFMNKKRFGKFRKSFPGMRVGTMLCRLI